jgi:hypothetical protein
MPRIPVEDVQMAMSYSQSTGEWPGKWGENEEDRQLKMRYNGA